VTGPVAWAARLLLGAPAKTVTPRPAQVDLPPSQAAPQGESTPVRIDCERCDPTRCCDHGEELTAALVRVRELAAELDRLVGEAGPA
jgi:hypothetical protein